MALLRGYTNIKNSWIYFSIAFFLSVIATTYAQDRKPEILRVPAFTAYVEPDPDGMEVSMRRGVTGWDNKLNTVVWFGNLKSAGKLHISLAYKLPAGESARLLLTVGKSSQIANIIGIGSKIGEHIAAEFGDFSIPKPGYYRFTLKGMTKTGKTFGDIDSLLLSGTASVGAHFNMKERRNAASVHLGYPIPNDTKVTWFYNEVTVKTDPIWSYYMACGFKRGYFGIQVNSPTERRIIFSVWDSGSEAVDRAKVTADDRVQLVAKGRDVFADSFGSEGTGGHSHLIYPWKTGKTYRFLVSAQPDGTHTTYTGYFFFPERNRWELIASFRAPKDGEYLRGLYSFNENFGGANGELRRLAEFGNQWVKSSDGEWQELLTARFTHDVTGRADRKDYSAGVQSNRFYLSNGGFLDGNVKLGDMLKRPHNGEPPNDFKL